MRIVSRLPAATDIVCVHSWLGKGGDPWPTTRSFTGPGAQVRDIVALVFRQGLRPALLGMVLGAPQALSLSAARCKSCFSAWGRPIRSPWSRSRGCSSSWRGSRASFRPAGRRGSIRPERSPRVSVSQRARNLSTSRWKWKTPFSRFTE